jgi:hypothetical protein
MNFLTEDDFTAYQVRAEVLSVLTISGTTLDAAQLTAQEQMSAYLRARYDVVSIFATTGADRNPLVVMYMIDMILYHLHSNTPNRVMPKAREDRFNAAIAWLTGVNQDTLIPDLPVLATNTPDPVYRFGSDYPTRQRW